MTHPLTDLLLAHRANRTLIDTLPAALEPVDAQTAYQVQTETVHALGPVGAWKVQPYPEQGEPFTAPILSNTVFQDGVELSREDFAGLAIEGEIAVKFNRALDGKPGGYTVDDVRDAIGSLHIAIEVLGSRFIDRTSVPALVGIADLQSNGAVVVGPAMSANTWPELAEQALRLTVDGVEIASTAGNGSTLNTLTSLAWLANHAATRGLPIKAGDVIITGARLGPLPLDGKHVEISGDGFASVSATFS